MGIERTGQISEIVAEDAILEREPRNGIVIFLKINVARGEQRRKGHKLVKVEMTCILWFRFGERWLTKG